MTFARYRLLSASALWAICVVLSGCANMPNTNTAGEGGVGRTDVATASDETEASKRSRVRLELANAYFARGQMNTALDEVKLALNANPNLGEAYNLRGLIYAGMNEATLAQESFQRALQINTADADTMHNFGWFMCQQKRYDEAEALFQRAIAVPQYPNSARTLLGSGVCHARAGKWAEAETALNRAYERDPANPVISVNLAEVLYKRGDYERARFQMKRVNAVANQSNSQTLWLAARIEMKMGNRQAANEYGLQLRNRFPQSRESALFDQGRFND